jgi:hypothetical protein
MLVQEGWWTVNLDSDCMNLSPAGSASLTESTTIKKNQFDAPTRPPTNKTRIKPHKLVLLQKLLKNRSQACVFSRIY